jgi:tRNA (mo5U34)-methyltransferase
VEPDIQKRIDAIDWYHEFDFGNGLAARSKTHDVEFHRRSWDFIRATLDGIDFAGKSVLDIGCWDGYWSFYAEKRGAAHVLAADDAEQNWAGDSGLKLARDLLHSSIETTTNLSIYNIASLERKFDIILCLGVYYHLIDPFYAFAQIRHCCHENTIVVFEGDVASSAPPNTCIYHLRDLNRSRFQPSRGVLSGFLEAAYFSVDAVAVLQPLSQFPHNRESNGRKFRFRNSIGRMRNFRRRAPSSRIGSTTEAYFEIDRIILTCRPFQGVNQCFKYRPPFGLKRA